MIGSYQRIPAPRFRRALAGFGPMRLFGFANFAATRHGLSGLPGMHKLVPSPGSSLFPQMPVSAILWDRGVSAPLKNGEQTCRQLNFVQSVSWRWRFRHVGIMTCSAALPALRQARLLRKCWAMIRSRGRRLAARPGRFAMMPECAAAVKAAFRVQLKNENSGRVNHGVCPAFCV